MACKVWILQCLLVLLAALHIQGLEKYRKPRRNIISSYRQSSDSALHPVLYFSSNEVKLLRKKASTTHAKITQTIKDAAEELMKRPKLYMPPVDYDTFAASWNEHYGNRLCAFSFYCLLYPEDTNAMDLVKVYMDRLSQYPDWYVASSRGKDQVPVGHSLTGFATAFDFLYGYFQPPVRAKYYAKIKNVTRHMYEMLGRERGSWSTQYIHNHAPSNIVAILIGALVVSRHEPDVAAPWIKLSRIHMERAMKILQLVSDGSMDEGVSYGTYTTRGITQYVFFAKRHFGTDRTNNPWLKEYFWSIYETLLPGFQRSVGIADSSHNWFYGPESQLVFLDAFVLRNGYGNWLADKIRTARQNPSEGVASRWSSQIWCTIHTEFIFYDASIEPRQPKFSRDKLHLFPDWGVVTYGGGQEDAPGNTFLSFKSSAINGEAAHEIMSDKLFPEFVDGWKNFNAGHEHTDQNSFVFAPNGKYFVTEALYGPKYSYLDNVVVFSPSETSRCNQPWEGQIGECSKWLLYRAYNEDTAGEILTATTIEDMAFIAGEVASVYSKALGLSSVYRGVLLLNPEVLIVVDTIRLLPGSKTKMAAAMFHNMLHRFQPHSTLGHSGALVEHEDGNYVMFTMTHAKELSTTLHNDEQPGGLREGSTNYVNVTFQLNKYVTNVVHIFYGPHNTVNGAALLPAGRSGVKISLNLNGVEYKISVATLVRSTRRTTTPWAERKKVTDFGGYARVDVGSKQYMFGAQKREQNSTFLRRKRADTHPLIGRTPSERWFDGHAISITRFIFLSSMAVIVTMALMVPSLARRTLKYTRNVNRLSIVGILLLILLFCINSVCIDSAGDNTCWTSTESEDASSVKRSSNTEMPFVLIASLPGSGSELLAGLFNESNEFLYVAIPEQNMTIPSHGVDTNSPDFCSWKGLENKYNSLTMGWFHSLTTRPDLHFNNAPDNEATRSIKRHIRGHRNTPTALSLSSGFWTTKIEWVRGIVGENVLQPIIVVRDPRSWVFAIMDESRRSKNLRVLHSFLDAFEKMIQGCDAIDLFSPEFAEPLRKVRSNRPGILKTVEKLAAVWTVSTATALQQGSEDSGSTSLHVVRFEDLVREPQRTAEDLFGRLGVPLSLKRLSKLHRTVKSGFYSLPYVGTVQPAALDRWQSGLTDTEVRQIEQITLPLLRLLGYKGPSNVT